MEPEVYFDIETIKDPNCVAGSISIDTSNNNMYVYTGTNRNTISITTNPCCEISLDSVVFKDYIPSIDELEEMCAEYPGLEKAYENFKTFYKLVEQDWRGKQKEKRE
jgi:hypothetical protein